MQLHGATVTKIFGLTHRNRGDFNLYWSLDAVSALTRALKCHTGDSWHYRNESGSLGCQLATGVERGFRSSKQSQQRHQVQWQMVGSFMHLHVKKMCVCVYGLSFCPLSILLHETAASCC